MSAHIIATGLSLHAAAHPSCACGGALPGDSRRRSFGASPQSLGRSPAQLRFAAWALVPKLRAGADFDSALRHRSGMAAGVGRGLSGAPHLAGDHHGWSAGRHSHPHGSHLDAGGALAGLHSHRARQRSSGTYGRLPSCSPERDDPDTHGGRASVRSACWRARSSPKRSSRGRESDD